MNLLPLLDLAAVLLDTALLTLFLHIFAKRKALPPLVLAAVYGAFISLYYASSLWLNEAYQRSLAYLALCLLLTWIYRGQVVYKGLLVLIYASIGIMLETIMAFVLTMLSVQSPTLYYVLGLSLSSALFFIIIAVILRPFQKSLAALMNDWQPLAASWMALLLALLSSTLILSYALEYLTIKRGMANGLHYFLLLECLILALDVAVFFIFKKMLALQQESQYGLLLKQQSQAQEAFYRQSLQKNEQLAKLIHDEKNFLLGVIGALQEGQTDYALTVLQNKAQQLVSQITAYTGLLPLDNLLSVKVHSAAWQGIALQPAVALYGTLAIDMLDLVVLLDNALDNAICAAVQSEQAEGKRITMTMTLQEERLLLEIRNPVKERVPIREHAEVVCARRDELHGFGLANMARLVGKYNGGLWLDCTETTFILKLYLANIPADTEK